MSLQKPTPDYERRASAERPGRPSRKRIGDGTCNGILIGWALAVVVLIIAGIFCSVFDVTSGDGLTRTLAVYAFIVFPLFTVLGGILGAVGVGGEFITTAIAASKRRICVIGCSSSP